MNVDEDPQPLSHAAERFIRPHGRIIDHRAQLAMETSKKIVIWAVRSTNEADIIPCLGKVAGKVVLGRIYGPLGALPGSPCIVPRIRRCGTIHERSTEKY